MTQPRLSPSQRALNAANAIFQVRADGLISIPDSLQKLTSRAEVFQAVALLIDEHCPPQEPTYGIWIGGENGYWHRAFGHFIHGPYSVVKATFDDEIKIAKWELARILPFGNNGQPVFPDGPAPLTREEEAEECLNRR